MYNSFLVVLAESRVEKGHSDRADIGGFPLQEGAKRALDPFTD